VPLLAVTVVFGVCGSALMPIADALSLTLVREGRMEYGPVRAVGSIGFMVSIAFAGWLTGVFGSNTLPWLVALPYVAAALLTRQLPDTAPRQAASRTAGGVRLLTHRPFLLALAASALLQGGHAAIYGLGSLHWRLHGLPEGTIGLLWAEGVLAEILLFFAGKWFADRLGPAGLVGVAAVASLLRWTVIASTTALPALVAVQALHGATYGMTHLSAMLLLSRTIPPERAAAAQTLHAALGAVLPVGVLMWLTGQAYDGTGSVFWAMAGLGALALPVAWMTSRLPARRAL
jgi:PPP family 3-phenylpropionic acid transporter